MRTSKRTLAAAWLVLVAALAVVAPLPGGSIIQSAYRIVQDEGSNLAVRAKLNFTGAGVTCTDNSGSARTDCAIPGGVTSAYGTIQDEGSNLTARAILNFIGSTVTCVDNSGSTRTDCTFTGGAVASVFGQTGTVPDLSGDCTTSGSSVVTCAALNKIRSCVVIIGDPGAGSSALANDNDSPVSCPNDFGSDLTITRVGCYADAGTPTVTPILTGGTSTSILTGALTCGTASWAAGTVNGSPVIHSFSAGATCGSTPCTADVNITTAGGTAKYIIVRIVGTLP